MSMESLTGMRMEPLSAKQHGTLLMITAYTAAHGTAPSYADISRTFGITLSAAYERVGILERKGYVTRDRRWRSIERTWWCA